MKFLIKVLLSVYLIVGFLQSVASAENHEGLERVRQELVPPPFFPKHEQVVNGPSKIVQVRMVIVEKEIEIAEGVFIRAMTFNGSVPGPIIVVHEGDYVELTLENAKHNIFLHNIDFHAATGALGGGELTKVNPGEAVVLRFKATKPGVFVYHCAPGGMMVPYHVVMGMNGAIMVLPQEGLKDDQGRSVTYNRAYYIGEQDFYVPVDPEKADEDGRPVYKRFGSPIQALGDTVEVMRTLIPTYVVFNGAVGALTGEKALKATVGEKVLFVHAQANRDSRPHLIGGHGDLVWDGGSFNNPPSTNLETWFVPGGTVVAMLYEFKQPGIYAYVNHNLIEAFLLGAVAQVKVDGQWNEDLMKRVRGPQAISE